MPLGIKALSEILDSRDVSCTMDSSKVAMAIIGVSH